MSPRFLLAVPGMLLARPAGGAHAGLPCRRCRDGPKHREPSATAAHRPVQRHSFHVRQLPSMWRRPGHGDARVRSGGRLIRTGRADAGLEPDTAPSRYCVQIEGGEGIDRELDRGPAYQCGVDVAYLLVEQVSTVGARDDGMHHHRAFACAVAAGGPDIDEAELPELIQSILQ